MTLLKKPIKHDTCAVRQCGEGAKERYVKGFHLLTFVPFVFEEHFAVDLYITNN